MNKNFMVFLWFHPMGCMSWPDLLTNMVQPMVTKFKPVSLKGSPGMGVIFSFLPIIALRRDTVSFNKKNSKYYSWKKSITLNFVVFSKSEP